MGRQEGPFLEQFEEDFDEGLNEGDDLGVLVGVFEEGLEELGHGGEDFQLSGCWEDFCDHCYDFAEKIGVEGVIAIADDPFAHVDVLLELFQIQLAPPAGLFLKFLHLSVDALPEEFHQ